MTGQNQICVNQQEMCRLLKIALKSDVIREGVAFEVTQVESGENKSYSSGQGFTISIDEPKKPAGEAPIA